MPTQSQDGINEIIQWITVNLGTITQSDVTALELKLSDYASANYEDGYANGYDDGMDSAFAGREE
jgi:hypothetical protein